MCFLSGILLLFLPLLLMLKKYSITALLFIAYIIVLAHSIVPHHHHDDHHAAKHLDHDDKDDDPDSGLSSDFAKYVHVQSTADFHQQPSMDISPNPIVSIYILSIFNFRVKSVEIRPPIFRHSNDRIPVFAYLVSSKGLRAPPRFLV